MSVLKLKKSLMLIGKLGIATAVLWFLVHSAQIKPELFTHFFQQPLLSLSIICILLGMIAICAWRWQTLNTSQGIHLSFKETLTATYLGAAFNYVLPGSVGGDVVRMYYVFKKNPQKKGSAMLAVFFDRVMGFIAVFITISLVALLSMDTFRLQPKLFYLLSLCALFCFSVLAVFSLFLFLPEKIGLAEWLSRRFPANRWVKRLVSLLNAMSNFRLSKVVILKCLFLSVLNQMMIVCTVLIIAKIMGLPVISFVDYALAMGITQIVNLIPLTPGGVGIGEMAFANILQLMNPGVIGAFATIFFTYRVISIVTYLPGIIYYIPRFVLLKQRTELEETAAQA